MKLYKYIYLICLGLLSTQMFSQVKIGIGSTSTEPVGPKPIEINYASPKEYIIAEVTVTGSKFYDSGSLLSVTALQKGDKVRIPGPAVSEAIKKLMDQGILDDVQVLAKKVEADSIWLEVAVKERPRLGKILFTGIGKSDQDGLNA